MALLRAEAQLTALHVSTSCKGGPRLGPGVGRGLLELPLMWFCLLCNRIDLLCLCVCEFSGGRAAFACWQQAHTAETVAFGCALSCGGGHCYPARQAIRTPRLVLPSRWFVCQLLCVVVVLVAVIVIRRGRPSEHHDWFRLGVGLGLDKGLLQAPQLFMW